MQKVPVIISSISLPKQSTDTESNNKRQRIDTGYAKINFSVDLTDEVKEGLGHMLKDNQIHIEVDKSKIKYLEDAIRATSPTETLKTVKGEAHFLLEFCALYKLHSVKQKVLDLLKDLDEELITMEVADVIMSGISDTTVKDSIEDVVKRKCRNALLNEIDNLDNPKMRAELMKLQWKSVVSILTNPRLKVFTENTTFQVVRQWVLQDLPNRAKEAHLVLHSVRFPLTTAEYLMGVINNNDIFTHVGAEHLGQFSAFIAHAMFYIKSDESVQKLIRETHPATDYRRIYTIVRPDMGASKNKWVEMDWTTPIPVTGEFRSEKFLLHGYYVYINIRRETMKEDFVAITLHIDSKATGVKCVAHQMAPFHYMLYLKDQVTSDYVGVGVVDHLWTKENGWGKSLKIPDEPFSTNNQLVIKILAAIGRSPTPPSNALPTIHAKKESKKQSEIVEVQQKQESETPVAEVPEIETAQKMKEILTQSHNNNIHNKTET